WWPICCLDWSNDTTHLERYLAQVNAIVHQVPNDPDLPSFQKLNLFTAAMAQMALEHTLGRPGSSAETLTQASLRLAGAGLSVPGRSEVLRHEPAVIIDGANNPDGAEHLAQYLIRHVESGRSPRVVGAPRLILVLGILADKDYAAMIQRLAPLAAIVIVTQSSSPRAAPVALLATAAQRYCRQVTAVTPVQAAMEHALRLAHADDVICVTGSFYTIAEVDRQAIRTFPIEK
ncbi:MAG: hypothetical protein M3347_03290, partial [Armatimonadota bacterium]|nr:hypothetical protein [Armatimonadota bacterium]